MKREITDSTSGVAGEYSLKDFDYDLPDGLIAQEPLADRAASRLLVLDRASGSIKHRSFADIKEYLKPGDLLVLNDTRVIPARLLGHKPTGGAVELLLTRSLGASENPTRWEAMANSSKRIKEGATVDFAHGLVATVVKGKNDDNIYEVELSWPGELFATSLEVIEKVGAVPLPPYIKREADSFDSERYQTVFADNPGAVAAPTAGLHFTKDLLDEIKAMGVGVEYITLHTGPGTFMPVRSDDIRDHKMLAESYSVGKETLANVKKAKQEGRRIITVGSTATRTLEAVFKNNSLAGQTELFIYPGFDFKAASALLTNFHLPCSTLIMLVSAFAGRENILKAYREAVKEEYRFFSYGDAMLVV